MSKQHPMIFFFLLSPLMMLILASLNDGKFLAAIMGMLLTLVFLGPLRLLSGFLLRNFIPLTSNTLGVERLSFVVGLLTSIVATAYYFQWFNYYYGSNGHHIFFSGLVFAAAFLLSKTLVRATFWIKEGFENKS